MTETTQQTGMLSKIERKGEMAIAAMAAKSKAEVEARYVIALQRPRNVLEARNTILDSCKRPAFASGALYRKPVGKTADGRPKTVDGFSIRFAEEALKSMKNIAVDTMSIYEDDDRLTIRISVTDLETNTTYADEVRISKTVERRTLKDGQVAISERINSTGQKTFLVAATDDDLLNKINAAKSKAIRNSGLRLIPQDILEESWDQIVKTMDKGGGDPQAEIKKICDSFAGLNINPSELERYLKHSLATVSPNELSDLRKIYTAINEEETSWAAVMETAEPKRPAVDSAEKEKNAKEGAAAIEEAVIEKPYEHLQGLCKKDGVTETQVHRFMQSVKLAGEKTEELGQATTENMRKVIKTWDGTLPKIKKMPVE